MSPEQAFWVAILTTVLTVIVAPVIGWLLARRKQASDVAVNFAQSAKEFAEGGERAVAAAESLFARYDKIIVRLEAENDANKARIQALEAQIVSNRIDDETKRKRLIARIEAQESYIKLLVDILSRHVPKEEIPPMPEILTESQTGIKAVK